MSVHTSLTNASSGAVRPKAARDRAPHVAIRAESVQVPRRLAQHGDVGVAKAVDRLLAIADDEDGGRERTRVGQPGALAPGLDQQRHQFPLRAARVLELVHEHVVVARLEPVAALRELLHLPQQVERAQQQIREIEHGVRVERPAVLRLGDAEHPPDAARHEHVQIAAKRARTPVGRRPRDRRRGPDACASRPRRECALRIGRPAARLAVLRQEVLAHAGEHRLHRGRFERRACLDRRTHLTQAPGDEDERSLERSGLQEAIECRLAWSRTSPGALGLRVQ